MSTNLNIRVPKRLMADFEAACQDNYTNKSEVLRRAMIEYVRQNQKEVRGMKKVEIVVIEAGVDYMDRLESFELEVSADESRAIEEAVRAVEAKGYTVISNSQGGCNEFVSVTDGEDYIAVTVAPSAE